MLVVVYDDVSEVAFRFETQRDILRFVRGAREGTRGRGFAGGGVFHPGWTGTAP